MMRYSRLLCLFVAALAPLSAGAQSGGIPEERVFIVKQHRYVAGEAPVNVEVGESLCATRCSALSADYLNFTEPGGWRFIKVVADRELTVDLDNPFMGGKCICVGDEYLVKIDDLNKVR